MKNDNEAEFSAMRAKRLLTKADAQPSMYINDISKLFDVMISHQVECMGMSGGYRKIICHIAHNDGITQLGLVKKTHLTAPSVSVALAKMEKDGLVCRIPDKNDLRQVKVYLTDEGRKMDDTIRKAHEDMENIMLKGFSEEEKTELLSYLRRILENTLERSGM